MKVRDLMALLGEADPEDLILLDRKSGSLLLLNVGTGLHQPFEDDQERVLQLTEEDKEFLRTMRIPT